MLSFYWTEVHNFFYSIFIEYQLCAKQFTWAFSDYRNGSCHQVASIIIWNIETPKQRALIQSTR